MLKLLLVGLGVAGVLGCASSREAGGHRASASRGRMEVARNLDFGGAPGVEGELVSYRPSPAADAPPQAPAPAAEQRATAPARQVIYTASFSVLCGNAEDTLATFLKRVAELGGHMQSQDGTTVTVRVPAARFEDATRYVPELGRVTRKKVDAQDVTQAWADLHIRLENAEKARTRILALLDRAQKMEEIIVLEKELRRLTEEIETMKAQLRGMDDQIAFSTITVEFRSNAPEIYGRVDREVSPFGWINQVGAEHALGR
jgi:hypothetical protein